MSTPDVSRQRALAVVVAVVCLLGGGSACASGAPPAGGPATVAAATTTTPALSTGESPGTAVPPTLAFSSATVGGGHFEGASLLGSPAVLWFWAAWCPRCRAKATDVKAVQAAHDGKVTFVGVAGLGSGSGAMAQFVSQLGLGGFTQLADDEGSVWRHFGVTEQEFFIILDRNGTVVHKGPLGADELRDRVAALAS